MDLSKWNPFKFKRAKGGEKSAAVQATPPPPAAIAPYESMQRAMQRLFDEPFFKASPWRESFFSEPTSLSRWFGDFAPALFQPTVDVVDEGKALRVTAELPGMDKGDVEVHADDGMLIIKGEKRSDTSREEQGCYRTERAYGMFQRVIPLPSDVLTDGIEATFDKGLLTVRVPKSGKSTAETEKKIPIK